MDYTIAILGSSVVATFISGLFTLTMKLMEKKGSQSKLLNSITRDRIKQICRKKIMDGYITFDEMEDLVAMHKAYHENGGNGYCDDLMERVKRLPLKEDGYK